MNTDLKNLAEQLGIEEYPEILEAVFESTQNEPPLSCVTDVLTQLHEEYDPFGKYYDFLLQGAEEIKKSRALLAWLSLGVRYCKDVSDTDAARFPLPPSDQSLARDAFPAILIAMEFPETVKRYRARGFDDVQIKRYLSNLERNLYVHEITQGRTALSAGLYCWLTHYTKALIFDEMGFNFQVWKWRDEAILLKHRKTGEYAFLMLKGNFTAHGTVAGMRGREDEPTLFEATLEETEDAFIGYRAKGQQVSTVRERFEKSEWEAVLRTGDDVINFHIPRATDLTPAHVEESISIGTSLMARYYPEYDFKYTVCTSWMLDPKLLDILPESSKISQFIRHFHLHPSGDTAGVACMSYVFPGENGSLEELSEKTSLQRGIKSMMLQGSFTFWTTGVWI